MFKRILLVVALVIIATPLLVTNSNCWTFSTAGLMVFKGSCYFHAEALIKGFGFCEEEECGQIKSTLTINEASCGCKNPGGNCGGLGQPFYPDATVGNAISIGEGDIVGRGQAVGDICWDCDFITNEIEVGGSIPPDYCDQNDNWEGLCNCYVTNADASFVGCQYDMDSEQWYLIDQLDLIDCSATLDDLQSMEPGDIVYYNCSDVVQYKYKLQDKVDCPYTPGSITEGCIGLSTP